MVDRRVVQSKLAHIAEQLEALDRKRTLSRSRFLADEDLQAMVLHRLQLAIQGSIDLSSHLIADAGWEVSASMVGLFDALARHRVISVSLAGRMKTLVKLRNLIVHEYADLDMKKIHAAWHRGLPTLAQLCQAVRRYAHL